MKHVKLRFAMRPSVRSMVFAGTAAFALGVAAAAPEPALAGTRSGLEVGLDLFDYAYRERMEGQTVVRDDGTMVGLAVGYTARLGPNWFVTARGSGARGEIDYSSEDGRLENVRQDIGRFDLEVGRDFHVPGFGTVTPFTGIGGRRLWDNSAGHQTETGQLGYDRDVLYVYLPIGISASMPTGGGTHLALSAQYNLLVGGRARSKLSELDPDVPDLSLDLRGGRGLEASASLTVPVGRQAISVGPFLRHWRIRQSESFQIPIPDSPGLALEFFEPANRTRELGVRLSFRF